MSLELIEGAVGALTDYLEDYLPAELDTLEEEYADGIDLTDIKAFYKSEQASFPEFPVCSIIGEETLPTGEGNGWMKASHTITIGVIAGDQDAETLRKKLYRYMRAIIECLIDARSSTGWEYAILFDRVNFSPLFTVSGEYLSDAQLTVRLISTETD